MDVDDEERQVLCMMIYKTDRHAVVEKELKTVSKQEQKLAISAYRAHESTWRGKLTDKIPEGTIDGLEKAFCAGFSLIFRQGRSILEKAVHKEDILRAFDARDAAVRTCATRRELKELYRAGRRANAVNCTLTAVEGVGLGMAGVGMPDIVLFLCNLLKGVYETALHYGYDYEDRYEQLIMLRMMATALSKGRDWTSGDREVDTMMSRTGAAVEDAHFDAQLKSTASAFAMDMLLLKFVQGLPLVGVIGGAANPVYYRKVMDYVQLKYRKRYLMELKSKL